MRKVTYVVAGMLMALAVLYAGASWVIMGQALSADAVAIERHPDELGASYQDVAFSPRGWDDITLRGWWMPAPEPIGTIIWQHGLDSTKDSRLEVIVGLREAGFSVLAVDMRGHGESDLAPMGAGIHEQDDILGAIDWLVREQGVEPGTIGLMGVSYGASILLLTAPRAPEVRAVLADSAFAELTDLIVSEVADRTPIPEAVAGLLRPGVILAAKVSRGVDVGAVVPADAVARLDYPVAIIHCRTDTRITLDHGQRIFAAAPPGSTITVVEGCKHAKASDIEGDAYVERAVAYFTQRFAAP